MSARYDYATGEAGYTGSDAFGVYSTDAAEARVMQPFNADQSQPWWQSLILYGATKAIDNQFTRPAIEGNTNSGTFGGANGRTYGQTPTATGGAPTLFGRATIAGVPAWVVLAAGAAVVVYLATRR